MLETDCLALAKAGLAEVRKMKDKHLENMKTGFHDVKENIKKDQKEAFNAISAPFYKFVGENFPEHMETLRKDMDLATKEYYEW